MDPNLSTIKNLRVVTNLNYNLHQIMVPILNIIPKLRMSRNLKKNPHLRTLSIIRMGPKLNMVLFKSLVPIFKDDFKFKYGSKSQDGSK